MTLPSISIIIPTYNVAPYIRKCLESVSAQTYKGKIECLIIDDCGPDNSIQIAEDFIQEYYGSIEFRIIHREKNGGLSAARNSGICEAKGDYLYFLDSDDWISDNCVEILVTRIIEYPEVDLVVGGAYIAYLNRCERYSGLIPNEKTVQPFMNNKIDVKETLLGYCKLPVIACNKLYRRNMLVDNGIFFREGLLNEDVLFNYHISKVVNAIGVCYTPTYYYFRREDGINLTISNRNDKYFLAIANEILDTLDPICIDTQIRVCLKIVHKRYVYSENAEMHKRAKVILKRIFNNTSVLNRLGILLLILLPNRINKIRRVYSNLFMFKIFKNGYMYQI